jgi:uncharacterized protein YbjT (DUF2867 family)
MEARRNSSTPPILVTGGTGTLGPLVVARLREAGRDTRVLTRSRRDSGTEDGIEFVTGDLSTGNGIDAAVQGIDTILHLAGSAKGDEVKAQHLVDAAAGAGTVRHIVYISVVGADRIAVTSRMDRAMFGYFAQKLAAEQIVEASGIGWTTLRATQFHELSLKTVEAMARLPIVPVPAGWRFQPIDAADVADRLVELALGPPAGLVPPVGGPRVYEMADLVRSYLRATGRRRLVVTMPVPGGAARAFREGPNLVPDRAVGRRSWEEFLVDRVGARGASASTNGLTLEA